MTNYEQRVEHIKRLRNAWAKSYYGGFPELAEIYRKAVSQEEKWLIKHIGWEMRHARHD